MATRSTISTFDLLTDRYLTVYCHWDGYLKGVGETLYNNWTNYDEIMELIAGGGISILGQDIQSTKTYHRWRNEPIQITESDSIEQIPLQDYNYYWNPFEECWYLLPVRELEELEKLEDFL